MHTNTEPEPHARVLVAVITRQQDLDIARFDHWYRIPLARAPAQLTADYVAFYQTAAFKDERWRIAYYAPIVRYRVVSRRELLPNEPQHPRANNLYYRIDIGDMCCLPVPVPAARLRRVTFIATTFGQLCRATDVRALWHPPEDDYLPDDCVWGAGMAGKSLA